MNDRMEFVVVGILVAQFNGCGEVCLEIRFQRHDTNHG